MKKLIQAIGIAIISIAGGCNASFAQSWLQVGNTLQRQTLTSPADTNYRFSMGSPGFMYFYDKYQVDQLISGGSLTFTAPLVKTGTTVSITQATTSVNGYLTYTDWNTFNGKQAALGFTPENVANKVTTLDNSATHYPSTSAVTTALGNYVLLNSGASPAVQTLNGKFEFNVGPILGYGATLNYSASGGGSSLALAALTGSGNFTQSLQWKTGTVADWGDDLSNFTNTTLLNLGGSNQTLTQTPNFQNGFTINAIGGTPGNITFGNYEVTGIGQLQVNSLIQADIADNAHTVIGQLYSAYNPSDFSSEYGGISFGPYSELYSYQNTSSQQNIALISGNDMVFMPGAIERLRLHSNGLLEGAASYSAYYDANSYIQKGYADATYAGSGSGVTSITGTTNQITVSPTTGAAVASIPSTFNPPGSVNLVGAGGAGFISTVAQSSAPATPASGTELLYSNSSNQWTFLGHNGFAASLTKSLLTASQVYSFPNSTGTLVDAGVINWPGTIYSTPTTATVTSAGVLTFAPALSTQTANTFLAGPSSGSAANPAFRAIVAADIPTLNQNTTGQAGSVANAWTPGSTLTNTSGAATYNGSAVGTYDVNQAYAFNFTNNISIAGASTGYALSVSQNIAGSGILSYENTNNSGYSSVDLKDNTGTKQMAFGYANTGVSNANLAGLDYFYSSTGANFSFQGSSGEWLRINSTGLGISTSSPTTSLTFGSTSTGTTSFNTTDQTTNYQRFKSYWNGGVYTLITQAGGSATVPDLVINSNGSQTTYSNAGGNGYKIQTSFGSTVNGGTGGIIQNVGTVSATSGAQVFYGLLATINQPASTAANTIFKINTVNTAVGSGTFLLADMQYGSSSKWKVDNNGNVTQAGSLAINQSPTAVNCSTSGTANFNETEQGSAFKMVVVTLSAALGTASYTYATAFTNTPVILTTSGLSASLVTTNGTSSITITGATSTGTLILMGN